MGAHFGIVRNVLFYTNGNMSRSMYSRSKNPLSLHAPLGLGLRGEQEREFFGEKHI